MSPLGNCQKIKRRYNPVLETFYTEQEYYIHLKISGYVQGPQSKVESGGIRTRMGKHLRGVGGGGGELPPENLNFLDVLK